MDPTKTAQEIVDSYNAGNVEECLDHCYNLREWLDSGGFAPAGMTIAEGYYLTMGYGSKCLKAQGK